MYNILIDLSIAWIEGLKILEASSLGDDFCINPHFPIYLLSFSPIRLKAFKLKGFVSISPAYHQLYRVSRRSILCRMRKTYSKVFPLDYIGHHKLDTPTKTWLTNWIKPIKRENGVERQ